LLTDRSLANFAGAVHVIHWTPTNHLVPRIIQSQRRSQYTPFVRLQAVVSAVRLYGTVTVLFI